MPEIHMTFDEMLEELGELGKFQIINYILICFPVVFAAANSFTYLFVAGQTEFRLVSLLKFLIFNFPIIIGPIP